MRRLLKSRKALSPVIASIILVAVTVAVSIAVAAWMGALTFSFTKTDQFNVASMSFFGTTATAPNYINMTIQNTGSSSWTLTNTAQVNSYTGLAVISIGNKGAFNCTNSKQISISITMSAATGGWASGQQYSVVLLMSDGTKITYVASAP
jgi:flagellin-like protein